MKVRYALALLAIFPFIAAGESDCNGQPSSDEVQRQQQERILKEGVAELGMPAIRNFQEKRLLKMIYELRDQANLSTYTYLYNEMQGKLVFLCDSVGYGIPYATQYTSPDKPVAIGAHDGVTTVAQADPNGLFSPSSAEGTWVMCKDPKGKDVQPVYIEPRVIVSQFKLD